jgi:NAD-reducing hydrogenase small subunit
MTKPRLATIWLDGCSGCHMSLLDMDERLLDLPERVDIVYGALVDIKEFPADVDVTLVEGAVSSEDDLRKILEVRRNTRVLVSLGDCAVTANVPGMRNPFGPQPILERAYLDATVLQPQIPVRGVPRLLELVRPVHAVVKVDVFVPGCPPSADLIHRVLDDLLSGRTPQLAGVTSFG